MDYAMDDPRGETFIGMFKALIEEYGLGEFDVSIVKAEEIMGYELILRRKISGGHEGFNRVFDDLTPLSEIKRTKDLISRLRQYETYYKMEKAMRHNTDE